MKKFAKIAIIILIATIAAFAFSGCKKVPISLEVSKTPVKTLYEFGDNELDLSGGLLTARYKKSNETISMTDPRVKIVSKFKADRVGEHVITLEYRETEARFTVTVADAGVMSIEVLRLPSRVEYYQGEPAAAFNPEGGLLKVFYADDSLAEIPMTDKNVSVSGFETTDLGIKTIIVTYMGAEASFQITVAENSAKLIRIKELPLKLVYYIGDTVFDPAGLIIEVIRKDDTAYEVAAPDGRISYSGVSLGSTGEKLITITLMGFTDTFAIVVDPVVVSSVFINSIPYKTEYVQGDMSFSLEGGSLTLVYNNGFSEVIDMSDKGVTVLGFYTEDVGKVIITVRYLTVGVTGHAEYEDIFEINVVELDVQFMSIASKPAKLTYEAGTAAIDLAGGAVNVEYNNGITERVAMNNEMFTVSGFDTSSAGTKTIKISYSEEIFTTFEVIVYEPAPGLSFEIRPQDKYFLGDDIVKDGVISVSTRQGTYSIPMADPSVTVESFDTSTVGTKYVTLKVNGEPIVYRIIVVEPIIDWNAHLDSIYTLFYNTSQSSAWYGYKGVLYELERIYQNEILDGGPLMSVLLPAMEKIDILLTLGGEEAKTLYETKTYNFGSDYGINGYKTIMAVYEYAMGCSYGYNLFMEPLEQYADNEEFYTIFSMYLDLIYRFETLAGRSGSSPYAPSIVEVLSFNRDFFMLNPDFRMALYSFFNIDKDYYLYEQVGQPFVLMLLNTISSNISDSTDLRHAVRRLGMADEAYLKYKLAGAEKSEFDYRMNGINGGSRIGIMNEYYPRLDSQPEIKAIFDQYFLDIYEFLVDEYDGETAVVEYMHELERIIDLTDHLLWMWGMWITNYTGNRDYFYLTDYTGGDVYGFFTKDTTYFLIEYRELVEEIEYLLANGSGEARSHYANKQYQHAFIRLTNSYNEEIPQTLKNWFDALTTYDGGYEYIMRYYDYNVSDKALFMNLLNVYLDMAERYFKDINYRPGNEQFNNDYKSIEEMYMSLLPYSHLSFQLTVDSSFNTSSDIFVTKDNLFNEMRLGYYLHYLGDGEAEYQALLWLLTSESEYNWYLISKSNTNFYLNTVANAEIWYDSIENTALFDYLLGDRYLTQYGIYYGIVGHEYETDVPEDLPPYAEEIYYLIDEALAQMYYFTYEGGSRLDATKFILIFRELEGIITNLPLGDLMSYYKDATVTFGYFAGEITMSDAFEFLKSGATYSYDNLMKDTSADPVFAGFMDYYLEIAERYLNDPDFCYGNGEYADGAQELYAKFQGLSIESRSAFFGIICVGYVTTAQVAYVSDIYLYYPNLYSKILDGFYRNLFHETDDSGYMEGMYVAMRILDEDYAWYMNNPDDANKAVVLNDVQSALIFYSRLGANIALFTEMFGDYFKPYYDLFISFTVIPVPQELQEIYARMNELIYIYGNLYYFGEVDIAQYAIRYMELRGLLEDFIIYGSNEAWLYYTTAPFYHPYIIINPQEETMQKWFNRLTNGTGASYSSLMFYYYMDYMPGYPSYYSGMPDNLKTEFMVFWEEYLAIASKFYSFDDYFCSAQFYDDVSVLCGNVLNLSPMVLEYFYMTADKDYWDTNNHDLFIDISDVLYNSFLTAWLESVLTSGEEMAAATAMLRMDEVDSAYMMLFETGSEPIYFFNSEDYLAYWEDFLTTYENIADKAVFNSIFATRIAKYGTNYERIKNYGVNDPIEELREIIDLMEITAGYLMDIINGQLDTSYFCSYYVILKNAVNNVLLNGSPEAVNYYENGKFFFASWGEELTMKAWFSRLTSYTLNGKYYGYNEFLFYFNKGNTGVDYDKAVAFYGNYLTLIYKYITDETYRAGSAAYDIEIAAMFEQYLELNAKAKCILRFTVLWDNNTYPNYIMSDDNMFNVLVDGYYLQFFTTQKEADAYFALMNAEKYYAANYDGSGKANYDNAVNGMIDKYELIDDKNVFNSKLRKLYCFHANIEYVEYKALLIFLMDKAVTEYAKLYNYSETETGAFMAYYWELNRIIPLLSADPEAYDYYLNHSYTHPSMPGKEMPMKDWFILMTEFDDEAEYGAILYYFLNQSTMNANEREKGLAFYYEFLALYYNYLTDDSFRAGNGAFDAAFSKLLTTYGEVPPKAHFYLYAYTFWTYSARNTSLSKLGNTVFFKLFDEYVTEKLYGAEELEAYVALKEVIKQYALSYNSSSDDYDYACGDMIVAHASIPDKTNFNSILGILYNLHAGIVINPAEELEHLVDSIGNAVSRMTALKIESNNGSLIVDTSKFGAYYWNASKEIARITSENIAEIIIYYNTELFSFTAYDSISRTLPSWFALLTSEYDYGWGDIVWDMNSNSVPAAVRPDAYAFYYAFLEFVYDYLEDELFRAGDTVFDNRFADVLSLWADIEKNETAALQGKKAQHTIFRYVFRGGMLKLDDINLSNMGTTLFIQLMDEYAARMVSSEEQAAYAALKEAIRQAARYGNSTNNEGDFNNAVANLISSYDVIQSKSQFDDLFTEIYAHYAGTETIVFTLPKKREAAL